LKDVLDPLTRIPGVRCALLLSADGVPIAVSHGEGGTAKPANDAERCEPTDDLDAFCGLAAGWYGEVHRAVDPLAWDRPSRISMRCARGTLVMQGGERAILAVLLRRGAVSEELRLPMEAAVARLERNRRRGMAERQMTEMNDGPPGIFPGVSRSPQGTGADVRTQNEVPETSGER